MSTKAFTNGELVDFADLFFEELHAIHSKLEEYPHLPSVRKALDGIELPERQRSVEFAKVRVEDTGNRSSNGKAVAYERNHRVYVRDPDPENEWLLVDTWSPAQDNAKMDGPWWRYLREQVNAYRPLVSEAKQAIESFYLHKAASEKQEKEDAEKERIQNLADHF